MIQLRHLWWNYFSWITSICWTVCWDEEDGRVIIASYIGTLYHWIEYIFSDDIICSSTTVFILLPHGVSSSSFFWALFLRTGLFTYQLDFSLIWPINFCHLASCFEFLAVSWTFLKLWMLFTVSNQSTWHVMGHIRREQQVEKQFFCRLDLVWRWSHAS